MIGDFDCSELKSIQVETHRGPIDTFAAIDDFTGILNERLKDIDVARAMVAVTLANHETGAVTHQTLELTPHDNGNPLEREVEVTSIYAVPVPGQAMQLYRTLAEQSGIWLSGDELSEQKPIEDGDFIEFAIGDINNDICLAKVSN